MKFLRIILFPVVPIYFLITHLRNWFYDCSVLKSYEYDNPVICVGNLSTGGTGKTPMIELLIHLLKDSRKLATLSRGYKRKTEGFVLADSASDAEQIGDEPYQMYRKFGTEIRVAVDSNRKEGIETLLSLENPPDVILLDDAFQHRRVRANLNILLTSYNRPYYNDILLPTGNLRESKSGAKRADIIVVTKCPELVSQNQKDKIFSQLKVRPNQRVFFSWITYDNMVISHTSSLNLETLPKFALVTGIANAAPLVAYLHSKGLEFDHLEYPDHYAFKPSDLRRIAQRDLIITTEKDYVRLSDKKALAGAALYYLPIRLEIDRLEDLKACLQVGIN